MRYVESTGASHDIAVKVAAMYYTIEIRQYGFEDHDSSFEDFSEKFVNNGYSNDGQAYTTWVSDHEPAVDWALDFANLWGYLDDPDLHPGAGFFTDPDPE